VPSIAFTANLRRHLDCPDLTVEGQTVAAVLANTFAANPRLRSYIVDEQGRLRRHVTVYVDDAPVRDRLALADPVAPDSRLHVFQLLTGG
jgi:molybdopterin synthase sulfur carrier subunit